MASRLKAFQIRKRDEQIQIDGSCYLKCFRSVFKEQVRVRRLRKHAVVAVQKCEGRARLSGLGLALNGSSRTNDESVARLLSHTPAVFLILVNPPTPAFFARFSCLLFAANPPQPSI